MVKKWFVFARAIELGFLHIQVCIANVWWLKTGSIDLDEIAGLYKLVAQNLDIQAWIYSTYTTKVLLLFAGRERDNAI